MDHGAVQHGLTLPIFDALADPILLAELAAEADAAGWDGVFVWDHVRYRPPVEATTDPWIAMAAMAVATERVRLGPMVTPLARRRPQIVARQLVALDHLSAGRMVLGAGLGLDGSGDEWVRFGEELDITRRAAQYDDALTLLHELLSGEEVHHLGPHHTADGVRFLPTPIQPRLPVWVGARWPNQRPLRRAAGQDGLFLIDATPSDLAEAAAYVAEHRSDGLAGFDLVAEAGPGDDPEPWAAAGATWLLRTFDPFTVTPADVRAAIARRP
jgi:alkanesulfonate monooxygenase SsuD/methylene tetrahydromethanopterin reductase-like flavin-dependent oxidoreductase (luciferase family)